MKNYSPFTEEEVIIKDIKKLIIEKNILSTLPFGNRVFGFMIPVWPRRSNGMKIEYKLFSKEDNKYFIQGTGGTLLVPGNEIGVHNVPAAKALKDHFVFEDFDEIPYKYYVISSNVEGIESGEIIYLRSDIMPGTIKPYNINGVQVIPINKEFIFAHKRY